MRIYRIVQATGNSQAGGASGGCLKLSNCPIASRVRSETRRPPPSGIKIAITIWRILVPILASGVLAEMRVICEVLVSVLLDLYFGLVF